MTEDFGPYLSARLELHGKIYFLIIETLIFLVDFEARAASLKF
jgi:hypothetical protein